MVTIKSLYHWLKYINWQTIRFNFHYFSFKNAIKLPVLVSKSFRAISLQGQLTIEGTLKYGMIKIGYSNIGIFDNKRSYALWDVKGSVVFKGNAHLGQGTRISVGKNGKLVLGNNFYVTAESAIVAHKLVSFGNDNLISWDVLIMDTDFHKIIDYSGIRINEDRPIRFGNKIWVGCQSIILKGTEIPDNCVLAARTMANGILETKNTIYGGFPINTLKNGISWDY